MRAGVSSVALPAVRSIGWPLRHRPAAFIEDRRSGRRRRRRAPAGARQWILGIERQLRRRADLTGSLGMSWKWASVETSRRHSAPAAQQCGSSPRHAALTSSSSMCRRRAGPQHGASHARRGEQALAPRVASRAPSRLATERVTWPSNGLAELVECPNITSTSALLARANPQAPLTITIREGALDRNL